MSIALFIDTNQYLTNLYGSIEGKRLLPSLEEQKEYIFISEQIANEVMRRKLGCAHELFDTILKPIVHSSVPEHLLGIGDEEVSRFRKIFDEVKQAKTEITKLAENALGQISRSEDDVSVRLGRLFDKMISPTEEELKQARARREKGNPPGKFANPLGDQITWEQLLTYCKTKNIKRLWIISSDTDYLRTFRGSCFINPFLHRELVNTCGSELDVRCFNKLGNGITDFGRNAGVSAEKLPSETELERINKELEALPPRGYIINPDSGAINLVSGAYFVNTNPWIENADLLRRRSAAIMHNETSSGPLTLRDLEES